MKVRFILLLLLIGFASVIMIDIGERASAQTLLADAGEDQTVNENETVYFTGNNSCDPDIIMESYDFDSSDEGFLKEADGTYSEVRWVSANGRIYFKSDRRDNVDERLVKFLPKNLTEDTCDWEFSVNFSILQDGWWTHAYPIVIGKANNTDMRFDTNQLFIVWERCDIDGPVCNYIKARYRGNGGNFERFMTYNDSKLNTLYTAKLSYNNRYKTIRSELYEEGVLVDSGEYIIGTNPDDGFTFGKFGVSANGQDMFYEEPVIGWSDDIQLMINRSLIYYYWDFDANVDSDGDGYFTNDVDATSTTPTHIYGVEGVYIVTLTVTDGDGLSDTDTCVIRVINAAVPPVPTVLDIETLDPWPMVAIAAVITVILASLSTCTTEVGKYRFLSFFIPVYTRIKREKLLDQFTRDRIYEHIRKNPGDHYNSIKQELKLNSGALTYHLRALEKESYIKSMRDGVYKRFYLVDMKIPETPAMQLSSKQNEIIGVIKRNPGIIQKEIFKVLRLSQQIVSYHVNLMIESGLVRSERHGKTFRYYINDSSK